MTSDSSDNDNQDDADIDAKIAYHEEMEQAAVRASNYAKAAHHRNIQNILLALKEKQRQQQPFETPHQIPSEHYGLAATATAGVEKLSAGKNRSFPDWRNLYDVEDTQIEKLPWFSRELDPDLKQELENKGIKSGKILDLGTGPATQAIQLSKLGLDVTATDISEGAIARAKKLSKEITFVVDDIVESKLKTSQFDYIFDRGCFHVLEPIDRPRYVSKVKSLLKTGGLIFLKTFSIKEPMISGPHRFSVETIRTLFERDFEILSSKETVFQGTLPLLPKALFTVMRKKKLPPR